MFVIWMNYSSSPFKGNKWEKLKLREEGVVFEELIFETFYRNEQFMLLSQPSCYLAPDKVSQELTWSLI